DKGPRGFPVQRPPVIRRPPLASPARKQATKPVGFVAWVDGVMSGRRAPAGRGRFRVAGRVSRGGGGGPSRRAGTSSSGRRGRRPGGRGGRARAWRPAGLRRRRRSP